MRIAQIVHGLPPQATGGTELYVDALSQALARMGHDLLVVAREEDPDRREYAAREDVRGVVRVALVNNTFAACTSFEDSYRNPRLARVACDLVRRFQPEIVHVHHLTCLSSEIPARLDDDGIPLVMTLHDYWLMCHRGQLLNRQLRVCAGPAAEGCGLCIGASAASGGMTYAIAGGVRALRRLAPRTSAHLAAMGRRLLARQSLPGVEKGASLARVQHMRDAASHVKRFLAPSDDIRNRFIAFGIPPERIVRHEQGIDLARFQPHRPAAGPVRLGYLGSLVSSKGAEVLLEAFQRLPRGSAVLRVYGSPARYHDDEWPAERLETLLATPGIEHVGPIPREAVPPALRDLDAVVVPSIWPENAPFVLREARAAAVPVIASRIGGIPEYVQDGHTGLLFEPGNVEDCAHVLRRFVDDSALRAALSQPGRVRSLEDDAQETLAIYTQACRETSVRAYAESRRIASGKLAAVVLNYRTPEETLLAVRSLMASDRQPDLIVVVDNDSPDNGESLRRRLPGASVIPLNSNRGFAGGVNAGIRYALEQGASHVFLLNSDAVVAPDTLSALERALHRSHAGIVGAALVSRSDPGVLSSLGMSWSPATGRMRHASFGRPAGERSLVPTRQVDGVSGCAMLVRRDVFERCGTFEEEYFFGFEDLSFCLRAAAQGFPTVCCPDAVTYHEGGGSLGQTASTRVYFSTRNHLKLASAQAGTPWSRTIRTAAVLGFNLAYVVRSRNVRLFPGLLAFARGTRDHFIGRYGAA